MDKKTEAYSTFLLTIRHPAQLWLGPPTFLAQQVTVFVQKIFCAKGGCVECITCNQIKKKQYHAIKWYYPDKQYTIEYIQDILSTVSFKLKKDQYFFFVIQKADFLTPVCANRLLKVIEEPPTGYHFLFLAERKEQLLPTIRSRCIIKTFYTDDIMQYHSDLYSCFKTTSLVSPSIFLKIVDQSNINERETIELFDALLVHWGIQYKKAIQKKEQKEIGKSIQVLALLIDIAKKLPMPGSSKLFWRNLFLEFCMLK